MSNDPVTDSALDGEQESSHNQSPRKEHVSTEIQSSRVQHASPVVLKVKSGLCNRLRTLASFYAFSVETQRPFLVNWDLSAGWSDERFEDLFDNQLEQISTERYLEYERDAICLHREMLQDSVLPSLFVKNVGFDITLLKDPTKTLAYFGHFELTMMMPEAEVLWPNMAIVYKRFLRGLKPVRTNLDVIDRISSRFNTSTIGVHVRRGDALQTFRADRYLVSSDQAFIESMERAISENEEVNFFLATDCEQTQSLFQERFGDRIIVNENKKFVASILQQRKDNQADATIDLWLLSRTKLILGNNWSSFSEIAAELGGISVTIVRQ